MEQKEQLTVYRRWSRAEICPESISEFEEQNLKLESWRYKMTSVSQKQLLPTERWGGGREGVWAERWAAHGELLLPIRLSDVFAVPHN